MLGIEVTPSAGGDTAFASMYAALQTLSRPMSAFLAGCSAVHAGDLPFRGAYKALHPAFGVVGLLSPDAFRLARDDGRRTALPRTA